VFKHCLVVHWCCHQLLLGRERLLRDTKHRESVLKFMKIPYHSEIYQPIRAALRVSPTARFRSLRGFTLRGS
jgi:hypothetical protein